MKSKAAIAILTFLMGVIPSLALASEPIEAAEYAVRQLIRGKMGSQYRVVFENSTESFLSFSEMVVTGTGHIYDGSNWDFDRSFSYKIKVRNDGASTRELVVTFTNGEKHADTGSWTPSKHKDQSIHLVSPRWYENVNSGGVVFEGTAARNVSIEVFDRNNRKVAAEAANVSNGRFRVVVNVPNGQYRAVVSPGGWEIGDEVRFTVNSNGQDWGQPEAYLKVAEPARNSRLTNSRVTFSGNSSERSMYLQVWDDRNKRVVERDIPVKNRYWNSQVVLGDGSYRYTVSAGRDAETRNFIVDTGKSKPKPKPTPGSVSVRIYDPRNESSVGSSRVLLNGTCPDSAVLVQVFDDRGSKRYEQRVNTNRGSWSTTVPKMNPGRYRLRVTGHSGSNYDEIWFNVR
ncbi:MAG: hypothetical protein IT363_02535 [Methanoregulaceae archaeon]|nr:hypothetical protein [Methanoregulaceae archaeon]